MKATIYSQEFKEVCGNPSNEVFDKIVEFADAYASTLREQNNAYLSELCDKYSAEIKILAAEKSGLKQIIRTQPEATKPAQDLQLVVATSTETGFFHVVIHMNDGKRSLVLYDKQHSLNGDTVGVADIPAAALAFPADALAAGDRVDAELLLERERRDAQTLATLLAKERERFEFLHSTNCDAQGWEWGVARIRVNQYGEAEYLWGVADHSDIDAVIQAQKDGHG